MPYLDLDTVAASLPAIEGVGMAQKRTALAGLVREALTLHDDAFVVQERIRRATLDGAHRADRVGLMGDPVRYAEIDYAGIDTKAEHDSVFGTAMQVEHRFRIGVWVGYDDADAYDESSQALFDAVAESLDAAKPGLAHVLFQQPVLEIPTDGSAYPATLGFPDRADVPELVPLNRGARGLNAEYAHFFALTITVT